MLWVFLSYCFEGTHSHHFVLEFSLKKGNERLLGYFFCFFVQFFTFFHVFEEHFSENCGDTTHVFDDGLKICKSYAVLLKCFFDCLFIFLLLFLANRFASWKVKLGNIFLWYFFFDLRFSYGCCRRFLRNSLVCATNRGARASLLFLWLLICVEIQGTIFH